jgi:G-patch domain/FHA domain
MQSNQVSGPEAESTFTELECPPPRPCPADSDFKQTSNTMRVSDCLPITGITVSETEDMENGEIEDVDTRGRDHDYDPSLEWAADTSTIDSPMLNSLQDAGHTTPPVKAASWVTMRLLVTRTSILSRKHRIAVVDAYPQLQFGRDVAPAGTDIPRIRLKEMEVSKVHATAYWDADWRAWAVVDMGSKHGTFLKAQGVGPYNGEMAGKGIRLSHSKVASVPRKLRHLDRLTIGSTTFLIHIHGDQVPCIECSPQGGDEIPLFPGAGTQDETSALKRTSDVASLEVGHRNPKKALTMLKRTLLTQHHDAARQPVGTEARYTDRSARRRELHPSSHLDVPGISRGDPDSSSPSLPPTPSPCTDVGHQETAPSPLPTTNVGHRLLVKQGWQPGTSLGHLAPGEEVGLLEPLQLNSTSNRAGLGMHQTSRSTSHSSWKENAKQNRWEILRSDAEHGTSHS